MPPLLSGRPFIPELKSSGSSGRFYEIWITFPMGIISLNFIADGRGEFLDAPQAVVIDIVDRLGMGKKKK